MADGYRVKLALTRAPAYGWGIPQVVPTIRKDCDSVVMRVYAATFLLSR
jgi:hypothetical protein